MFCFGWSVRHSPDENIQKTWPPNVRRREDTKLLITTYVPRFAEEPPVGLASLLSFSEMPPVVIGLASLNSCKNDRFFPSFRFRGIFVIAGSYSMRVAEV